MEAFGIMGMTMGTMGMVFGMIGMSAAGKIAKLEKKLKELEILDEDYR